MLNNFLKSNNPFWHSAFVCIKKTFINTDAQKKQVTKSHRILITKNKPRALNCKKPCSSHVAKLPLKHLKGFDRKYNHWSIYFIQYLLVCILSKKCLWWWIRYTQTMHSTLNIDFPVFPFVGFLHLSHCSLLVPIVGYSFPAQPLPHLQDSTLPCRILGFLYPLTGPSHHYISLKYQALVKLMTLKHITPV